MPNYTYPIDEAWTTEEISTVVTFFSRIEQAYERGVNREALLAAYREFKEIVPSKMEEKQLDKQFSKVSGYAIYPTIKKAKEETAKTIKMTK